MESIKGKIMKRKILYVHHGDINGGAPRSLKFLIDKIDNRRYEAYIVCRTSESDAKFFENENNTVILEKKNKTISWKHRFRD